MSVISKDQIGLVVNVLEVGERASLTKFYLVEVGKGYIIDIHTCVIYFR